MIGSAAVLLREHGVDGTSFSRVLELSGAPRGSIYHHFPGGKSQLVEEATRYAGDLISAGLAAALGSQSPVTALGTFGDTWKAVLEEYDFRAGCPVVAATLSDEPDARRAAAQAFRSWQDHLAEALRSNHVEHARARRVGTMCVAAMEGAIVMARAERSIEPLLDVVEELQDLVTTCLSAPRA